MDRRFRPFARLAAAGGLALLLAAGAFAAPAQHPIDARTRAALDREAHALLRQKGVTHVGFYGFTIDPAGHVTSAWVVRSAGNPRLDEAALAMIRKAILKRRPAGAPVRMQFVIPIEFRRHGAPVAPSAP
ncbi:energy transducer TonB [Acidiphilium sp.]|uniref:energy transducer TonB family protein n=1 Tax=Acidiphilium sp. TaxID=527 RepID=UPI0025875BA7|nr:energy transducer TonB [Acidiphilium sp.]